MSERRTPFVDRLLRWLVRLLPADFRGDFGDAIVADLAERREAGDRTGLVRRELPSLIAAVVREHASALRMDVKYAWRTMRRTPGFTATAIVMLALGTGVNTAMFTVIDAVMVRSAFPDSSRLVFVHAPSPQNGFWAPVPVERYAELVTSPGPLTGAAAFDLGQHVLTGRGDPRTIDVECVSASMFDVLGTRPFIGRGFNASEDRDGADPVMVLSYDFWRELGARRDVVGSSLTVNQTPVTVVGVMPRGFSGPYTRFDVAAWLPISRTVAGGGAAGCTKSETVQVVGRLRGDLTLSTAARSIPGMLLVSVDDQMLENVRTPLLILTGAVICILLLACFNVGGLQLERTLARRREMALRLALGASRSHLVRQTLVENLLLAGAGALAGVVLTSLTLGAIVSLLPVNLPHLGEIEINTRVLAAAIGVASIAGTFSGLIPIFQTRRFNPGADLAAGTRSTERRGTWTRRTLVTVEIALSIVVLIGATLMIRTFLTLRPSNPGFDPANKTSILVRLPGATPDVSAKFFGELFARVKSTPGLQGAVGSTYLPMWGTTRNSTWSFNDTSVTANTNYTTTGYFEFMKIPVVAGRTFTADDTRTSQPVVVVNETLARKISPDGRVLGRQIAVRPGSRPNDPPVIREIVGVIGDMRSLGSHTLPMREAYIPYVQNPISVMFVTAPADARNESAVTTELRNAVRALRPDLPVDSVGLMTRWMNSRVARPRFGAWLLGTFAVLAVTLAAIGLMTTIGWWVNLRTREIGVRLALGASPRQVGRLVLRQGMALGGAGIVIGCAAAAGATRYLEGSIYGVKPLDPVTFAGCAVAMLLVAGVAVALPMRRATSVDPVRALRAE